MSYSDLTPVKKDLFATTTSSVPMYSHENGPRTGTRYARADFDTFFANREPQDEGCKRAFAVLKKLVHLLPGGTIIAGGFVSGIIMDNYLFSDIDLFFESNEAADQAVGALVSAGCKLGPDTERKLAEGTEDDKKLLDFCNTGPTAPWSPQVVKFHEYDDAEHCLDFFDFTATQFAIDVGHNEVVWNPLAPIDYAARRLNFHRMESQRRVEDRVLKYSAKGFRITPEVAAYLANGGK